MILYIYLFFYVNIVLLFHSRTFSIVFEIDMHNALIDVAFDNCTSKVVNRAEINLY